MHDDTLVTLAEVEEAQSRIRPWVLRTPLVAMSRAGILLKAENLQPSGAFKLRGAFNTLLQLAPEARARGVVAHSSGNHAIAVALASARLGIDATIVMPENAPAVKLDWVRALGARLEVVAAGSSERAARAAQLSRDGGLALVEPFDARSIIAGTGTIGLEIVSDLGRLRDGDATRGNALELYVPISGGGLIAGVAVAAKALDPAVRVIGVEPELAADALASRRAGRRIGLPAEQVARTLADGLRVQMIGALTWPHLQACVDAIVTVSEAEILDAMRRVAFEARLVAEPSGAVSVAAALAGRGSAGAPPDRRVAILSGGNVDPDVWRRAMDADLLS